MDILFFHGFSASPWDLRGAINTLEKSGHQVTATTLKSCSIYGPQHSSSDQWVAEAEQTLLNFAESTSNDFAIAGHSLGGILCAYLLNRSLSEQITNRISKCAFLATPAGIDKSFLEFWKTDASHKIKWPFSLQVQMLSFLQHADCLFNEVNIPSVVLQGGKDKHIPPSSGKTLSEMLGKNCTEYSMHQDADHFFPAYENTSSIYLHQKLAAFLSDNERS